MAEESFVSWSDLRTGSRGSMNGIQKLQAACLHFGSAMADPASELQSVTEKLIRAIDRLESLPAGKRKLVVPDMFQSDQSAVEAEADPGKAGVPGTIRSTVPRKPTLFVSRPTGGKKHRKRTNRK